MGQNGISPRWKYLKRKLCFACGEPFKPVRPSQKYCCGKCRQDFNDHGSPYIKLKPLLEKYADKKVREATKELRERVAALESRMNAVPLRSIQL